MRNEEEGKRKERIGKRRIALVVVPGVGIGKRCVGFEGGGGRRREEDKKGQEI